MIAENSPGDDDGIPSFAPGLNVVVFTPAGWWVHQVVHDINYYPSACEVDGFTNATNSACKALDGMEDGIISHPDSCGFNAHEVVGQTFLRHDNTSVLLTEAGADAVEAAWRGPRNDRGNIGWFGATKGEIISGSYAATLCDGDGGTCGLPDTPIYSAWLQWFVARDPDFVVGDLTRDEFLRYLQQSDRWHHSTQSAARSDPMPFRVAGGKMISLHGLADQIIPPNGSAAAYEEAHRLDPHVGDYFRYYEAPGVAHCSGGPGAIPNAAFDQLVAWVEQGVVPETLRADARDGSTRPLCPYPGETGVCEWEVRL